MRGALLVIALIFSPIVFCEDDAKTHLGPDYRDMDPNQNVGVQFAVCKLNEGYDLKDVYKLGKRTSAEFTRLGINASQVLLTPFFASGLPSEQPVDYLELTYAPIEEFGSAWDKWSTKEAANIMDTESELADCTYKFMQSKPKYFDTEAILRTDRRIVSFQWCSRKAGVSWQQLGNKHDSWLESNKESVAWKVWNILIPRLGGSPQAEEFAHFNVYTSVSGLMENESQLAENGFSEHNDYHGSYVDCGDTNVWNGSYTHKRN